MLTRQTTRLRYGKGRIVVLAFFVFLIASAVLFPLLKAGNNTPPPTPPAQPPEKPSAVGEFRGIALQLHSGWEENPYEQYIDQIAATAANTICFVIPAYQENGSSNSIFIDLRRAPNDRRIRELIDYANGKGLRVVLMPIVLLAEPRKDEWRGKISPENWDTWWRNYRDIIIKYAKLARWKHVDVYVVGSELISTELFTDRWRELIAAVRGIYDGRLAYSANWDHYKPIEWWDDLDIIGMTTYYDLTSGEKPTLERLLKAWEPIKQDVLAWQAKINRPIMFTEVGWPNQETCAQYPWNYYASSNPDPQAQANCFEAFFRTWINEPTVAGYIIWEWQNSPDETTGPEHIGYIPTGKPAMDVINKYYGRPDKPQGASRPAGTQPATSG